MQILSIFLMLISLTFGIFLLWRVLKSFNEMTMKENTFGQRFKKSLLSGVAGCLLFFSLILLVGFLDENYQWSINKIVIAFAVSIFPGLIIIIGSLIQFGLINQFRKGLFDFIKNRSKK